jgi:AcrR family transcriptional regulator
MESINRRSQILDAAAKLFSERGYTATSMRDIAENIEMEAASLYNHIASKEALLHSICFETAQRFINAIAEVNDIYFNGEDKLKMAVNNHVQILTENLYAAKVFLYEWRNLNTNHIAEFIELRDRYEKGIIDIIETGEQENIFNEVDKKFAALNILSSVNWIVEWYKPEGQMTPKEIASKLCDFILSGLKKQKPF